VFHFLIISILLSVIYFSLLKNLGVHFIYDGLLDAARNSKNPNYNGSVLLLNSASGMKYGLIALVVALGQVLLDQGYYSIAMSAKSPRDLTRGFLIGAVIFWVPISILSASVFGHGAIALKLSPVQGIDTTTEIATTILSLYGSAFLSVIFAIAIFSIGVTTGGNCLIGILSIFTVDFYGSKLRPAATDAQKIRFGKIITVCIAALCAFIAIALEGISLLKIDMFSGIFFAAPCGTLIGGVYSKFANENVSLFAIFSGLITGFSTWLYFDMSSESWFYGCLLSFLIPIVIILVSFPFTRQRFNPYKLKLYKSDYEEEEEPEDAETRQ
jgi:Na+/proline symporter